MGAARDVGRGKSRSGGKTQMNVTTQVYQLIFLNSVHTVLTTGMHTHQSGVHFGCVKLNSKVTHVDTTRAV